MLSQDSGIFNIGYEMVDIQLGTTHNICPIHVSNKGEWNNCLIKNAPKI